MNHFMLSVFICLDWWISYHYVSGPLSPKSWQNFWSGKAGFGFGLLLLDIFK